MSRTPTSAGRLSKYQESTLGEQVINRMLPLAAAGEFGLGLVLLVYPPIVVRLLFNAQIEDVGIVISRVAGIVFIALGVACWPGMQRAGMLTYSGAITLYLVYLGFAGGFTGIALWPAVVLHVILTALLAWRPGHDKETKA